MIALLLTVPLLVAARWWHTRTVRPCGLCGRVHGRAVSSVSCEVEMGERTL